MAPRTRQKKTGKENVNSIKKSKLKESFKVAKPARKPLADKTNSASDDNATIDVAKKATRNFVKNSSLTATTTVDEKKCPRRQRRIPNRFMGDNVLNTSLSKEVISTTPKKNLKLKDKNNSSENLFSKTPLKNLDSSLSINRPKRISRLPSRLEDHSISPSKFVPVQPCSASTPIVQKHATKLVKTSKGNSKTAVSKKPTAKASRTNISTKVLQQKSIDSFVNKISSDSNNNPKKKKTNSNTRVISPTKRRPVSKKDIGKVFEQSFSFRVLENKRSENDHENKDDVYEFTFDPTQEPTPQKKKRKKVVKRKPAKPKIVIFKSNYNKKLSQSLQALKSVLKKNAFDSKMENITENVHENDNIEKSKQIHREVINAPTDVENPGLINQPSPLVNTTQNSDHIKNHASVRIEDIAAAFEPTPDHHDIDYSPVNTPNRCPVPDDPTIVPIVERQAPANDPLNLQQELSFFDEQPVASSSMNLSTRHPTASPWRVDYENLPIKWNVNAYIKPNMTPAIECSYVDNNTSRKKHVYTNILQEPNVSVPDPETITTHLKQTSIISFIKELVNKSINKKKKKAAVTPTKQNSLFEDTANTSTIERHVEDGTTRKSDSSNIASDNSENVDKNTEISPEVEAATNDVNRRETRKRKNKDPIDAISKTPRKDKDQTLFGFDDSENCDQENVSPKKVVDRRKNRNLRPRAVLQEINKMAGPMRAVVPAKDKLAMNSEVINKMYEELKSATPAPVFPDKNPEMTNLENDDSQSIHLFEDIELVHHLKPTRKSYGKAKKVTFRQHSSDSNDSQVSDADAEQESYDDLADLSFEIPTVKAKKSGKKKMTKKQKKTKEENKEFEEWATQFNSMCDDIEHVDLVVE